jgi:hypothetical protein
MLEGHSVICAGDVPDEAKAFVAGCVIMKLLEAVKMREGGLVESSELRHVIIIKDLRHLLRGSTQKAKNEIAQLFFDLLREASAYGEGIIIVDEFPRQLDRRFSESSFVNLTFRLPGAAGTSERGVGARSSDALLLVKGMSRPLPIMSPF